MLPVLMVSTADETRVGDTVDRLAETTSTFSPAAKETADFLSKRLVLIDGEHLAGLMIRYNMGCRIEEILHIKKVDEDFFE